MQAESIGYRPSRAGASSGDSRRRSTLCGASGAAAWPRACLRTTMLDPARVADDRAQREGGGSNPAGRVATFDTGSKLGVSPFGVPRWFARRDGAARPDRDRPPGRALLGAARRAAAEGRGRLRRSSTCARGCLGLTTRPAAARGQGRVAARVPRPVRPGQDFVYGIFSRDARRRSAAPARTHGGRDGGSFGRSATADSREPGTAEGLGDGGHRGDDPGRVRVAPSSGSSSARPGNEREQRDPAQARLRSRGNLRRSRAEQATGRCSTDGARARWSLGEAARAGELAVDCRHARSSN